MGFLDRLFGREEPAASQPGYARRPQNSPRTDDEIAVERYRYLLRTAPPETIEQVHEEAFTKLTPEQRDLLFEQLTQNAPDGDQPRSNDPQSLAQSATRAEIREPGTMERTMSGGQNGPGVGAMIGSSLLGTVAGFVIGSAIVSAFLPPVGGEQAGDGDQGADSTNADTSGSDAGADAGGADTGADAGGGFDFGGGGDFGGGDFGF